MRFEKVLRLVVDQGSWVGLVFGVRKVGLVCYTSVSLFQLPLNFDFKGN